MSSLHGTPSLIPIKRNDVCTIKPFLLNKKQKFIYRATQRQVPFIDDPTNKSEKYIRNYVTQQLVPRALVVNPGLYKVIRKKYLKELKTGP
jgi:tRNA(Ile)-lysidine synthase TilS/MesJ